MKANTFPLARKLFDAAYETAGLQLIEECRKVLRANPRWLECVMGMGVIAFFDATGRSAEIEDLPEFYDVVEQDFMEMFGCTWLPARFTADGPITTEW